MALPFVLTQAKRRDQIVAIDLGSHASKAVHVQRKGETYSLAGYVVQEAPKSDKAVTGDVLSQHLRGLTQSLGARTRQVVLVIGVNDAVLRPAELPAIPISDMRTMLKHGSKNYLQQDLPDHVFDCFILPPKATGASTDGLKSPQKCRVLVGAAKRKLVEDLQEASKAAGLLAEQIVPSLICAPNAFEQAQPEIFTKEVVALVDVGFRNTTISMLLNGELILTRVVGIGGDRLTGGLAEALGTSYTEAEGIKVGMPGEVQSHLEPMLTPLGRELRASLDFFEHQQDKTVSQVFISGGSARSELVVQCLQAELMVPCRSWNPAASMVLSLPPQQMGELEQLAPQLTIAIGAAMSAF